MAWCWLLLLFLPAAAAQSNIAAYRQVLVPAQGLTNLLGGTPLRH